MKQRNLTKLLIIIPFVALLLCSCVSKATKQSLKEYNRVLETVQVLERQLSEIDLGTFSGKEILEFYNVSKDLYYDYNPMDLKAEQKLACEELKNRVDRLRIEISRKTTELASKYNVATCSADDKLLEKTEIFPIHLKRGEKLIWNLTAQKPITVKIINYNSRTTLKTYTGKSIVKDSLAIDHEAIYLIEVNPNGTQYLDMNVSYKVIDINRLAGATPIKTERIECKKGDFGAVAVPGVSMRKIFEEPRKFTLRGQLKATFSGSAIALVAVQVPAGTTDILYSMRIDTSEKGRSEDGKFYDNLNASYSKVKFLGLPLYEKTNSSGLLNTLLDENRPLREEDAYCNMYVFRNQTKAKQFQDGAKLASQLSYDVDYSTLGTQSCNGRIPANGSKTIYLGFQNERVRYTNYLWVEAVAIVANTTYYTTKYSVAN